MSIPDFSKFGVNTYRSQIRQQDSTVTLTQRTWLAAIALAVFGMIPGFFFVMPMVMKGDYTLTAGRIIGGLLFLLLTTGAVAYAFIKKSYFSILKAGTRLNTLPTPLPAPLAAA